VHRRENPGYTSVQCSSSFARNSQEQISVLCFIDAALRTVCLIFCSLYYISCYDTARRDYGQRTNPATGRSSWRDLHQYSTTPSHCRTLRVLSKERFQARLIAATPSRRLPQFLVQLHVLYCHCHRIQTFTRTRRKFHFKISTLHAVRLLSSNISI